MVWLGRLLSRKGSAAQRTGSAGGIRDLEEAIKYTFREKSLLVAALRHRSYVHANGDSPDDLVSQANERLEFLGDAVLGLLATEYLYREFPDKPEGELTKRKSVLVSKSALARCALEIHLDQHVLLSSVEEGMGGRQRRSILGDAFEALVGAIYLDGGLEPSRSFLETTLFVHLREYETESIFTNYKSLLLEHVQAGGGRPPEYMLRSQSGPDHQKTFTVEVAIGGKVLGTGTGTTKKHAQQEAARLAYERLTGRASTDDDQNTDERFPATVVQ